MDEKNKWKEKKYLRKPLKWLEYKGSTHNVITPKDLSGFVL